MAVACLPLLIGVHSGRWGAPTRSHADVLSWMPDKVSEGAFRVLWLGDPTALPLTGWHLEDGLAFATSRNGPPTAADQWAGPERSIDARLADPVRSARRDGLVDLGHRLAPLGVRYIVVPLRAAPVDAPARPVPADLPAALRSQVDLRQIDTNVSLLVFENEAWVPGRAQLPAEAEGPALDKKADVATVDLSGGQPVLAPTKPGSLRSTGDVEAGEVLVAEAPSGAWQLKVGGRSAQRHPAFGVLGFTVAAPGSATLQLRTPLVHRLAVLVQLLLWLAALAVVAGGLVGRGRPGRGARHLRAAAPSAAPARGGTGVVLLDPVGGGPGPSSPRVDEMGQVNESRPGTQAGAARDEAAPLRPRSAPPTATGDDRNGPEDPDDDAFVDDLVHDRNGLPDDRHDRNEGLGRGGPR